MDFGKKVTEGIARKSTMTPVLEYSKEKIGLLKINLFGEKGKQNKNLTMYICTSPKMLSKEKRRMFLKLSDS